MIYSPYLYTDEERQDAMIIFNSPFVVYQAFDGSWQVGKQYGKSIVETHQEFLI